MEAPIQQAQEVEGQAAQAAPQATESQPQETSASQVERAQSTSQASVEGTPDYETARQIKNLMKEIRSLKQSLNTRSSETPAPAPQTQAPIPTQEEFLRDPVLAIRKIAAMESARAKEEALQATEQRENNWKTEQARQEGLRLIKTNELIKRDPEGEERVKEILMEEDDDGNSLHKYSFANPKHAAQLALKEYQARYGQRQNGVFAPSKAQMASTATAQTTGSGKATTKEEIGSIYAQLAAMPELMHDKTFMSKLDAVIKKSDMEDRLVSK